MHSRLTSCRNIISKVSRLMLQHFLEVLIYGEGSTGTAMEQHWDEGLGLIISAAEWSEGVEGV